MAEATTRCLACGECVQKGARAPANDTGHFLKRYLSDRCKENDINIDLDLPLSQSWVCRKCAKNIPDSS